jgi:pilus assembly protein Flp/PilA
MDWGQALVNQLCKSSRPFGVAGFIDCQVCRLYRRSGVSRARIAVASGRFRLIREQAFGGRAKFLWPASAEVEAAAMRALVKRFVRNESGTTAIEYAMIASGVALAIIAAVQGLGSVVLNDYKSVATALR